MDALTFLGHATARLRLEETAVITDPVLGRWVGPLRRQYPPVRDESIEALDAVLISHLHRDHLDLPSLRRVAGATPVIVPRGAGVIAARAGAAEIIEVEVGEQVPVGELTVTAVPARHDPRRGPFGPSAEPLGYLIGSARRTVYFPGDTDLFDGMSELGSIDLALMPVWGWGPTLGDAHMTPANAAHALRLLEPRLAVPIHWGTLYPVGLRRVRPRPLTDPPLEFLRKASAVAPGVTVRVLRPGEGLRLDTSPALAGAAR